MTVLLFREDAYLQSCEAKVMAVTERGIIFDRTIFYATAGGQPGDIGFFEHSQGTTGIANTIYDETKIPVHQPRTGDTVPHIGETVKLHLDWPTRFRNMRAHTMMHLLCASVPFPVTGSAIGADGGRIDFDIPEGQIPDKQILTETINRLIEEDHKVSTRLISEAELDANPELVRTVFVRPPRGSGTIRLVLIGADGQVDLQPCGGTHVKSTAEIGPITVSKIENKGKINRRIRIAFTGV